MARVNVTLNLPDNFGFKNNQIFDFDLALAFFDWEIKDSNVTINLANCHRANYQALSLVVLYVSHLKTRNCTVYLEPKYGDTDISVMWRAMGARGWNNVLEDENQNFKANKYKPLIAIRNQHDFSAALAKAEEFTKGFNVEYEKTLRYVISELLYNTLEHGKKFFQSNKIAKRFPSIIQFTWYSRRNEISFVIADCGVGIKKHLEQTYPTFESHEEAIRHSLRPHVSGTFGVSDPYKSKDNAGVGLFLSSNIVRKLHADMHIISGNGLVHISPRDITSKTLKYKWPGTFVLVSIKLNNIAGFNLQRMMSEFREAAVKELSKSESKENQDQLFVSIYNFFGPYAEDKSTAISYRDKYILAAIEGNKNIVIDFDNVVSAPHSFLSALLATPIRRYGMKSYKKFKIVNAAPDIRETIDYILDENTAHDD